MHACKSAEAIKSVLGSSTIPFLLGPLYAAKASMELVFLGIFDEDNASGMGEGSKGMVTHAAFTLLGFNVRRASACKIARRVQSRMRATLIHELSKLKAHVHTHEERDMCDRLYVLLDKEYTFLETEGFLCEGMRVLRATGGPVPSSKSKPYKHDGSVPAPYQDGLAPPIPFLRVDPHGTIGVQWLHKPF